MTVYLAWSPGLRQPTVPAPWLGPWREIRPTGDGLWLVDSDDTLSRVFHELKWSLPEDLADSPLLVAPIQTTPKVRGVQPGTLTWLRRRTHPPSEGTS